MGDHFAVPLAVYGFSAEMALKQLRRMKQQVFEYYDCIF